MDTKNRNSPGLSQLSEAVGFQPLAGTLWADWQSVIG
jgi:hypothetical protein